VRLALGVGTADNGYMANGSDPLFPGLAWIDTAFEIVVTVAAAALGMWLLSGCGAPAGDEGHAAETAGLIRADNDLGWKGWCYTGPDTLLAAFPGVVRHEISHALSPRLDQRFDHNAMCLWFSDPADFAKVRVCQFERDLTHD
jgi:hypothetical protein